MNIQSQKIVYFSPTGTTETVLRSIARATNYDTEEIDITLPQARTQALHTSENDLLIVGVPVYMGRVPALVSEWLRTINANNTPAVCVAVYGNREYDDALLELVDILTSRGCAPIAAAAFIGEHSFSSAALPIAANRPDAHDLDHATAFGRTIFAKLTSASSIDEFADVQIPGTEPYGGATQLWDVDFIAVSDACTQCGLCAKVCPVGAIDTDNDNLIDEIKCITCCACIKNCPQHARSIKPSPVQDAAKRLNSLYGERKEVEVFV